MDQKTPNGSEKHLGGGCPEGAQPTWARLGDCPPRWPPAPPLFSINTLGDSTKISSSHRKFQKPHIQSRHHHKGVHHPHWRLSDDA